MAEASDIKIGAQLGFAKAHHKITRRRKDGLGSELEAEILCNTIFANSITKESVDSLI